MSGQEANMSTTKKFAGGERSVPHSSQKAKKYYPAEDVKVNRKTRKAIRPAKTRQSIVPGTVVILLAGRFRGKRTIVLKHLDQGVLLVSGPFKLNGVPLRRVNARYVIATSTKVDISSVDEKILEKLSKPEYFAREKTGKSAKGEEAFFKQGEKPEAKKPTSERATDQKTIDKALLANIKKEEFLASYLNSSFSLRHGQKPHEMKF